MNTDVVLDCGLCLEAIPRDEGVSDEARDYVSHYCGLECYARWRALPEQDGPRAAESFDPCLT